MRRPSPPSPLPPARPRPASSTGRFFCQAEDGIPDIGVTGVQTCALPISRTALVSRLQAASTDWHAATVWFGLLLSAQTLIDSPKRREELKREHSRALGGEMEAHGL